MGSNAVNATIMRELLSKVCPPLAGRRVIEYGCGSGRTTQWLKSQSPRTLDALDADETFLRNCADRGIGVSAREKAQDVLLHRHDVREPWPFCRDSADVIIGAQVLSHLGAEALPGFFCHAARVLRREGGALVVVERLPCQDDFYLSHESHQIVDAAAPALSLTSSVEVSPYAALVFSHEMKTQSDAMS